MIDKLADNEERQFQRDGKTVSVPFGLSGSLLLSEALASDYSSLATYAVGEYCVYGGLSYRCTVAVGEPEAFDVSHWTLAPISDEMKTAVYDEAATAVFAALFSMDTDLSSCATIQDVAIMKMEQLLGETITE